VVVAGGEGLRGAYTSFALAHKQGFPAAAASAAFDAFRGDVGRAAFLGLALLALAWATARGKLAVSLASAGALVLLLASLWPTSRQVMEPVIGDPVQRNLELGRDDVVDFFAKQGGWGSFRVFEPQGNRLAGFGIGALNGYHAAKPRLFQDLVDGGVIQLDQPVQRWLPWHALLNVRYLALPQAIDPKGVPPFLRLAFSGTETVYENVLALPRVTVVGAYGIVPDTGSAAIDSVVSSHHDARAWTWLTKPPGVALGPVDGATATITHYGLHDVAIDVTTPGPAIVRLSDLWYPDWKATVDGHAVEILRADHALRAVVVPAGRHRVEDRFASASVGRGLALSIASLVLVLGMLVAGAVLGRRRPAAATGGA
jgi:hypothetical protein